MIPLRHSTRRHSLHIALSLIVALTLLSLLVSTVSAHANIVRSNPASGSSLTSAPARVQLWFSEEVEPSFSDAVIYDVNRQRVDLADSHVAPDDPRSIIVGVKPGLPSGTYTVAWKTQSRLDGHIVRGAVTFGIGVAVAPVGAPEAQPAPGPISGSPAEMVLRWLILTSAGLIVGAFSFWLVQRRADKQLPGETIPGGSVNQRRVALVAVIAFGLSNIGIIILQTSTAADVSFLQAIGAPLVKALSQTQYGELWIFRMIAAALLGLLLVTHDQLARRLSPRTIDWLGLAGGLALLGGIAATSHSASVEVETVIGYMPLGLVNDWVHLVAFAIWTGGLAQIAMLVPLGQTEDDRGRRLRHLATVVPRFSVVAGVSLAVVGVTGVVEGLIHVGNLDNLLDSGYGQALLGKIIVIFPLVALAAVNHYVIRPSLARSQSSVPQVARDPTNDVRHLFAWTIRIEVLLAIAVVAFVGIMTSMSPAQQAATAGSAGPLTLEAPAGDVRSNLGMTPGRPGPNRYVVDVRDANGQSVANISRATLRLTFLDSDLGVAEVPLVPSANGRFEAQSSDLAVAGRWQAEVILRRAGQDDVRATYQFAITSAGGQTLEPPPAQVSILFFVGILVVLAGFLAFGRAAEQRRQDLRRAAILGVCGFGLVGSGAFVSFQDFQSARVEAASLALARFHPVTPESVASGALVFRENCVRCHGLDAHGNGPLAPTLNPRPSDLVAHVPLHPDVDLINWISNGFPGSAMPAFQTTLTERQRWDVLNYLKSISEPSLAPVTPTATSPASTTVKKSTNDRSDVQARFSPTSRRSS